MNKLYLIIFITILCFVRNVRGQNVDTLSLYTKAVLGYIDKVDSTSPGQKIYLEAPGQIEYYLKKDSIETHNVILISDQNIKRIYRRNKNSFIHTSISPITVEGDKLVITITALVGTREGSKIMQGVSDGYDFIYRLNCDTNKYELIKIDHWGI